MPLTNAEIYALVERSLDDPDGVEAAVASYDLEEAKETVIRLVTYFGAFTHAQHLHVDELNKAFIQNPQMTTEERLTVLQMWLPELPVGLIGLAKTMQALDEYVEDGN